MATGSPLLIDTIQLRGFLSFSPKSEPLKLSNLNLVVGINGSGKSNFIDAFAVLAAAPSDITLPFRRGGGVQNWIWNRDPAGKASIDLVFNAPPKTEALRYHLSFAAQNGSFHLHDERLEYKHAKSADKDAYFFYRYYRGRPMLNSSKGATRKLEREEAFPNQSVLSLARDAKVYPELRAVRAFFSSFELISHFNLSRSSVLHLPQSASASSGKLSAGYENFAVFLGCFDERPEYKKRLVETMRTLYPDFQGYSVRLLGDGNAELLIEEGGMSVSASRVSTGTMRFFLLAAILLQPAPPPLICIDEPELGLHPDAIGAVVDLIKAAAKRSQVIATTHSPRLLSRFSDDPGAVLVCERDESGTVLTRLSSERLQSWLADYDLAELFLRGAIGGVRW
jgi:predicted ATPase